MAVGQLSALGFGSGVLKQSVIDDLKKAEESARITPYTKKIEENATKKKDVTELLTKLSTFQSAVSSLGDATVFAKRKVHASVSENPAASLKADSGVALQSMKLNVTQIAQKDVYQSKALANDSGYVNANLTTPASFTIFQGDKAYTVSVDKNTTYKDLASKITEATGGEIVAKVINTGEKGNPYRLTLTSKDTGTDKAIGFFDGTKDANGKYAVNNDATTILSNLGWELEKVSQPNPTQPIDPKDFKGFTVKETQGQEPFRVQKAQDALFVLDGIKMTRSSNTITDLGVGLTLTLNKTGEINFEVQQDASAASDAMQSLVDAYNDLLTNLNAATDYNEKTGTKGSLQGISEITSIRSTINSVLFGSQVVDGMVENENGVKVAAKVAVSLQDYGITVTNTGTLNFSSSKFETKMKESTEFAESFFAGITQYEDINYTSNVIESGKLQAAVGSGLDFKTGDFKIIYNDETYDLSKNLDGTPFKLTGTTDEEIMKNLVNHINSFRIEGLSVSFSEYDKNGTKGYELKMKGTTGTNFSIKGNNDVLKKIGLSETTITATPKEAAGIFAKLKTALQGITGKNGSLTKYDDSLTADKKTLEKNKESTQKLIDSRYSTMEDQFLAYEKILTKLNSQLRNVQSMIEAANKSNN